MSDFYPQSHDKPEPAKRSERKKLSPAGAQKLGAVIGATLALTAYVGKSYVDHDTQAQTRSETIASVREDKFHFYSIREDPETKERVMIGAWSADTWKGTSKVAEIVASNLDTLYTGELDDKEQQYNNEVIDSLTARLEKSSKNNHDQYSQRDSDGDPVISIMAIQAAPKEHENAAPAGGEPMYKIMPVDE
jgi:hypothetical protein